MASLYATKGGSAPSDLYILDPATGGILTDVGPIGYAVTGLAVDPTTGRLYGSTTNLDPTAPRSIITIDTATGTGTLVGAIGLGANHPAADIAFDASGQLYGWIQGPDRLARINKTTGAGTLTAAAAPPFNTFGDALDFDAGGTLWAFIAGGSPGFAPNFGYVYTVDPLTGAVTRQSPLTGGPTFDNSAVSGGKFDAGGVFWAFFNDFPVIYLVTIDVASGVVTSVATMADPSWDGLAWGPSGSPTGCSLAVSPAAVSLAQGGGVTSTVTSSLLGGPDSTVTLTATGLPSGVTAAFSANPIDENGGVSTVTLSASLVAPLGTTTVTIDGVDGNGNICTKPITVTVTAFVPVPGGGFSVRERVPFN